VTNLVQYRDAAGTVYAETSHYTDSGRGEAFWRDFLNSKSVQTLQKQGRARFEDRDGRRVFVIET
jgi:hypothetical protein